ncbi:MULTISPECIES: DUF488 domain-containing protein [Bacteroidaceae]|jgi:uncharacterized protein (DUF488 family)|uniref:DUF488 domain-containing protein n=1 Tax=Bacteroidales TaxID=171549 RepID=UPI001C7371C6|nr:MULTISPECIES: DUF488 domain-containing protein [Bacteroidaceae]MCF2697306.1 DUF488 domain-containing protein [Phocaeicola vulgatus]MCM0331880.1 DUF488 domain-containing protein [Bacteroides fragilis]
MINVFTIGVYGSTENSFFEKLAQSRIDLFCDIRQRRGVRGSQYKYVNSNYLQIKLFEMGIKYLYVKELAPTKEIRQKQKDADKLNNETKKQRTSLGYVFISEYNKRVLDKFDIDNFINELNNSGVQNIVLFCVEEHAEACHRSLVAQLLAKKLETKVINL